MLRRKNCVWLLVGTAFWTGCAFGPLGSNRAVSPVTAPIDYEGLARLSVSDEGRTIPQSLSSTQAETLWGQLAAENPEPLCVFFGLGANESEFGEHRLDSRFDKFVSWEALVRQSAV